MSIWRDGRISPLARRRAGIFSGPARKGAVGHLGILARTVARGYVGFLA